MEKYKGVTGLLVYPVVVFVIIAGMMIPKILIEGQQESIFNNTHTIKIQDKKPIFFKDETVITEITQSELTDRLASWNDARGTHFSREPHQDEFSMEAAFSVLEIEMEKLMEMGILPYINIQQLRLDSAELWANPAGVARWVLKLSGEEESMTFVMDAKTGKIYTVSGFGYPGDSILNFDRARRFAEYNGIEFKNSSYYIKIKTDSEYTLTTGKFEISVLNDNSSPEDFHLSIVLDIAR